MARAGGAGRAEWLRWGLSALGGGVVMLGLWFVTVRETAALQAQRIEALESAVAEQRADLDRLAAHVNDTDKALIRLEEPVKSLGDRLDALLALLAPRRR